MPRPHKPIPEIFPTLHIYRHLLREASYLPPAWREPIAAAIRGRFHKHHRYGPKTKSQRSTALTALRNLRAANSGHKGAMETLLQKGFARKGSRRRQLLNSFVRREGPTDSNALEALLNGSETEEKPGGVEANGATDAKDLAHPNGKKPAGTFPYEHWDLPKLRQLLRSQKTEQEEKKISNIWVYRPLKVLNDAQFVPKKTPWNKSPSEILVNSRKAHWWRINVAKMMVPLSKGEWGLLGRLSEGAQKFEIYRVPERRALARPLEDTKEKTIKRTLDWNWKEYASKPTAVVEQPKSSRAAIRTGQQDTSPYRSRREIKDITPRWYRRTYQRTWQITPVEEQSQDSSKHLFSWGESKSRVVAPTKAQLEIFQGVDSQGQKLPSP